jgi:hypothetical protein
MGRMKLRILPAWHVGAAVAALALLVSLASVRPGTVSTAAAAPALPSQLTDSEFWKLATESSEEDGVFRFDNLLSNEITFQNVIPDLQRKARTGRVYLGVGPEQNFTYVAALKPSMAIIFDIRHGNMDVHFLYKALFELSKDRAEFVGKLFSRNKPAGLTEKSTAAEIFDAYQAANGNQELFEATLKAVVDHLTKKHGFALSAGDIDGMRWALGNFYRFGPGINYSSSLSADVPPAIVGVAGGVRGGNNNVDYAALMKADDGNGQYRSFLANEETFKLLKDMQTRNLIVPVVGDFAGDKAIRAVGKYLKDHGALVSAFYLSNVEQYLMQDGKWERFCRNAAALPHDDSSLFIRSGRGGPSTVNSTGRGVQNSSFAPMPFELQTCTEAAK